MLVTNGYTSLTECKRNFTKHAPEQTLGVVVLVVVLVVVVVCVTVFVAVYVRVVKVIVKVIVTQTVLVAWLH